MGKKPFWIIIKSDSFWKKPEIENPVKYIRILGFCKKHGLVMQNQRLGTHIDKISADSTIKNIPKVPHN